MQDRTGPTPTSNEVFATMHKPASWFGPIAMSARGLRVFLMTVFRDFLDKRELQSHYPNATLAASAENEVLVDYVADTGDGFTATYSVFSQLNPVNMGYGDILIMGGDQIYPMPSEKNYAERFSGPLRAAVPLAFLDYARELIHEGHISEARSLLHRATGNQHWLAHQRDLLAASLRHTGRHDLIEQLGLDAAAESGPPSPPDAGTNSGSGTGTGTDGIGVFERPWLLAIPGNHDWYDGLTSFDRTFMQPGSTIGAFVTRQHRSYWAVELAVEGKRWWLWGIDLSLDSYVDRAQLDYFEHCGAEPGEPIVMFVAAPLWTYAEHRVEHLYQFERRTIYEKGRRLALVIAGDRHYYMRRESLLADPDGGRRADAPPRVTAGLGGSFTHPPHLERNTPSLWSSEPDAAGRPKRTLPYGAAPLLPRDAPRPGEAEPVPYSFPSERESRKMAGLRKSLTAWLRWNRTWVLLPFLIALFTSAGTIQTSAFWRPDDDFFELASIWDIAQYHVLGYNLLAVAIIFGFTRVYAEPDPAAHFRRTQRAFWTVLHGSMQLAALCLSQWAAQQLAQGIKDPVAQGMTFLFSAACFAAVSMTIVLLLYFAITTRCQMSVNAVGSWNLEQNYKGIVRLRFTADEVFVEVHGITDVKTESADKIWRRNPLPFRTEPEIVPRWDRAPLVAVDRFSVER